MALNSKIDFMGIIVAEKCNPNGDPICHGMPRITWEGYGEISQECLKRKIRNRLQDMGENIFIQQDNMITDGIYNLKTRAELLAKANKIKVTDKNFKTIATKEWIDIRSFGAVLPYKGNGETSGVTISVRGPVTISSARSIETIDIYDYAVTKSTNINEKKEKIRQLLERNI